MQPRWLVSKHGKMIMGMGSKRNVYLIDFAKLYDFVTLTKKIYHLGNTSCLQTAIAFSQS